MTAIGGLLFFSPAAPVSGDRDARLRGCPPGRLRRPSSFTPLRRTSRSPLTYELQEPRAAQALPCLAGVGRSAQRGKGGDGTSRRGTPAEQSARRPRAREAQARNTPSKKP